jgi:hypothetical protein
MATLPVKRGKCRHYLCSEHMLKRNSFQEFQEDRGERRQLEHKKTERKAGGSPPFQPIGGVSSTFT